MSGPSGATGADRAGGGAGADRAGGADAARGADADRDVTAAEADAIAADAVEASDDVAAGEAERAANALAADTFEVDPAAGPAVATAAEVEPPAERGLLGAAGAWVADTAVGYAQGAANTVLGAAELVNSGVNVGLDAVGIDYRFDTDMRIDPANETQRYAQDAVAVAELAAAGYGLVRSAPRIAGALEDVGTWARNRISGAPPAQLNEVFNGVPVGQLRPPTPNRHQLELVNHRTWNREVTTLAEPGVDMAGDVAAIRAGQGNIVGDRIHINGRTFATHGETLYPVEGAGLHRVDRGTLKVFQVMRQNGDRAEEILDRIGAPEETRARAAALLELLR